MGKPYTMAVAAGLASALLSLSVVSGSPLAFALSILAMLPLFIVGLGYGPRFALVGAGVGTAVYAVATSAGVALLGFAIPTAIPVWIATVVALMAMPDDAGGQRATTAWEILLTIAGYALLAITVSAFILAFTGQGLVGEVEVGLRQALEQWAQVMDMEAGQREQLLGMAADLARVAPGVVGLNWLILVVCNMALAQALLRRAGTPLRQDYGVLDIEAPRWASPAFLILVATAMVLPTTVTGTVAASAAFILTGMFFLIGLAVVHSAVRNRSWRPAALTVLYLAIALTGWLAVFIAALGVIEQWAGFRRRFRNPGPGQED